MKHKNTLAKKLRIAHHGRRFRDHMRRHGKHHALGFILLAFVVGSAAWIRAQNGRAAGIGDVAVTLSNEATSAASQATVLFTFGTLVDGNTIRIYLGETTGGNSWGLNGVATTDISCSDNGTGESYTVNSVTAASASTPLWTQITATTVGTVPSATQVTCVIGDGSPNPTNPAVAGNYSVAVVTTNDSGAGVAYVGNANDVTVTAITLPNLTMTIDNADGTTCTTTSGITSCNLGTVTTAVVNTGNYDVNVGTNAASGATLKIAEDGDLRNTTDTIDDVVEDTGGTVTAGVEEYGIAVVSDASWTEQGNYTDDDTPIPLGPATVATTAAPIAASGDDVTITHRVAVSSATKALTYSHVVTWTATANF
ncbi:MAG: hypothetical protein V1778_04540 [bacterium]